jgi:hypothetical protein
MIRNGEYEPEDHWRTTELRERIEVRKDKERSDALIAAGKRAIFEEAARDKEKESRRKKEYDFQVKLTDDIFKYQTENRLVWERAERNWQMESDLKYVHFCLFVSQ